MNEDHGNNGETDRDPAIADGTGTAGEPGCGARVRVAVSFDGDAIGRIECSAEGASTAVAVAEAMAAALRGMHWREGASYSAAELMPAARSAGKGGRQQCPPERAAGFAVAALHAAFEDALARDRFPVGTGDINGRDGTVLVAMSGGVDSATACLLAQRSGRRVIGVTLRLWSDPAVAETGTGCCAPAAIADARQVCHQLGIPHLTYDCAKEFEQRVVEYFTAEYARGRTPNPCTHCNGSFRFPLLLRLADRLGAGKVATGHYVRLGGEGDDAPLLMRGRDRDKDQSYVLWGIDRTLLPRLEFPLGEMLKSDTRRVAADAGLAVYERPESQEVCFIPDDDYRRFLRSRIADLPGAGDIVDTGGRVLGRHDSITGFTLGQRRGLGISTPEPVYVVRIEPETASVVVGAREELAVETVTVESMNLFAGPEEVDRCQAQLRYNSAGIPARVEWDVEGEEVSARLLLEEKAFGVAPGQSAVLYRDEAVVAGGIIGAAR